MRFPIEHEISPLQVLALDPETEWIELHDIYCPCARCEVHRELRREQSQGKQERTPNDATT